MSRLNVIMGWIAFSGDLDPDPDAAAAALRKAGFSVTRLPARFRPRLAHPRDDFLQAVIGGATANTNALVSGIDTIAGARALAGSIAGEKEDWVDETRAKKAGMPSD
jgi:hypothetical protein